MSHFLVIGGTGFIGTMLVEKLLEMNHYVTIISKQGNLSGKGKLKIFKKDISCEPIDEIISEIKPDVVIHLVAVAGAINYEKNPKNAFDVNVFGTFNVVNSIIKSKLKPKFIFLSSREVYGEQQEKCNETTKLVPKNILGLTKLLAENLILINLGKHGISYSILRITNVYGPTTSPRGINKMLSNIANDLEISVYGGTQILNLVHVSDVINSIIKASNLKSSENHILNIGSFDNVSLNDLCNTISQLIKRELKISFYPKNEIETEYFLPDITNAKDILDYEPQINLKDGIYDVLNFYKSKN